LDPNPEPLIWKSNHVALLYPSLSGGTVSPASEKMLKTWNENEEKAAAFTQVGSYPW
jgi:hypothetical protein